MKKKGEKIFVCICVILLLFCAIFYKPLEHLYYGSVFDHGDFYIGLGLFFGLLGVIFFNLYSGVGEEGCIVRFFCSIIAMGITTMCIGAFFELIEWVFENIFGVPY